MGIYGILCDLNAVRAYRKSLLSLAMLTSIVVASALASGQDQNTASNLGTIEQLPFCTEKLDRTIGRRLLYITTLDGTLSALDITKGGKVRWSVPTGPGPLISSSIHRLELTNNGQFVRMIPSLSGGIYKFDGETIDPIPITTENLLSSSFKFSDDLVISGGKETRSYGVSARTGHLLYECSMSGCVNSTETDSMNEGRPKDDSVNINPETDFSTAHDPLLDDVIVVRRQTQTIRAIESRTGVERWNFSVGQHELDYVKSAECHDRPYSDLDMAVLDLEVKVIVPEGIVCAFSKSNPGNMLWKQKFDHPIVSGWQIDRNDMIQSIDFLGTTHWLWDMTNSDFLPPSSMRPSIYLGMYRKQLYIQESALIRKEISDKSTLFNQIMNNESKLPRIPWKPILASNSLIVFGNDIIPSSEQAEHLPSAPGKELVPFDEDNNAVSAISVLYASEYVNGNGFYLYAEEISNQTSAPICNGTDTDAVKPNDSLHNGTIPDEFGFSFDDVDAPVKVVILSLWFWWKEIAMIVFTTAVLVNFLLGPRNRGEREIVVIERHIPVPTAIEATETSVLRSSFSGNRTLSESTSQSGDNFSSRFLADFDLERCLGRGGFGVVFEAKNKLDDCKYAIKRITLPNKKESRERVMREVKTLANCEHHNIVRYFQAWVETPPPGWQEEEDSRWLAREMSLSIEIETPDGTTLPSFNDIPAGKHPFSTKERKKHLESWISSVNDTKCSATTNGRDVDSSFFDDEDSIIEEEDEDEDEDSCIVFRSESQSRAMRENTNKTRSDSITIDIQPSAVIANRINGHDLDCSSLSDSFQIEFVHSANDENDAYNQNDNNHSSSISNRKKSLALDLNNRSKALLPAKNNQPVHSKIQTKVFLYIQMQLCRKESLRDWLLENKIESRQTSIKTIFEQIVDAVDYVHLKGLIHRDLKPSNIFFSQEGQIKIGDFGLVTDMSEIPNLITQCGDGTGLPQCAKHTQQVGTHLYMSPEQLRGQNYDFKVDIYSLGLILFELLVYFNTEMERIVTLRDLRDGKYPSQFSTEFPMEYDLLKQMLSPDPKKRPKTDELKMELCRMTLQNGEIITTQIR